MAPLVFVTDLLFQVIRDIRSMPPWHGARWSAMIRLACRAAGLVPDKVFIGLLPQKRGREPLISGMWYAVRLFLQEEGLPALSPLCNALLAEPAEGLFSAGSLRLHAAIDPVGHKVLWSEGIPADERPLPLAADTVSEAVRRLESLEDWHLHFAAPLRLQLPAGWGAPHSHDGRDRYCSAEFFEQEADALGHLLSHVRWMDPPGSSCGCHIAGSSLACQDLRYGHERHIALGGVAGTLTCKGRLNQAWALRLAMGCIFGCGKNARFGLGYWSVPEIGEIL